MRWYVRLRSRLIPCIYTTAADTLFKGGSIMRGLVSDFVAGPKTWDSYDKLLFGHAFRVAPVTTFEARSRQVYLPAGADWYDFNSGAWHAGGTTITAAAPRERMPLFVRAGSIVPTGPEQQYVGQDPDGPIILHVFTGADGAFSLYEDDGTSPASQQGKFARVPIALNEATGTQIQRASGRDSVVQYG